MAGRKDAEVHRSFGSNASAGPKASTGFGARNRIRGGAGDTGSSPSKVSGSAQAGGSRTGDRDSRGLGDAMPGSYGPGQIAAKGGIQLQDDLRATGKKPFDAQAGAKSKSAPFEPTMTTEREKLPSSKADPKGGPGNMAQGPEGNFGGAPGQSGSRRTNAYISR